MKLTIKLILSTATVLIMLTSILYANEDEEKIHVYQRIVIPSGYLCKEKIDFNNDKNFDSAFNLSHAVLEFTFISSDERNSDNAFINNKISGKREKNLKLIDLKNNDFNSFYKKNLSTDDPRYFCYPRPYKEGINEITDILFMDNDDPWARDIALLSLINDKDGKSSDVMNRMGSNLDVYQVFYSDALKKFFSFGKINTALIIGKWP